MHVRDTGTGPPVLLLHGQPGNGDDWSAVTERLVADHRVVVPDRPGYGASPSPARGLNDNADLVADVLTDLDVGPTTVVGHSWGGGVALALAQRHPHLVRALVLAASIGAVSSLDVFDQILALPFLGEVLAYAGLRLFSPVVMVSPLRNAFAPTDSPIAASHVAAKVREWRAGSTWRSFLVEQRAMIAELPAIAAGLGSVTVPTAVVVGGRDRLMPERAGPDLAAAVFDGRLVNIPRAGHALPFEAPDELASVIRELGAS